MSLKNGPNEDHACPNVYRQCVFEAPTIFHFWKGPSNFSGVFVLFQIVRTLLVSMFSVLLKSCKACSF